MEILLRVDVAATSFGVVVVVASGDVDFSTADLLGDRVRDAHRLITSPRAVVVDLGDVTFLSAAGVGVLVAAHERSRRVGVPLWVVAPHRSVVRTLAACDAFSVLHVVAESPAASAAVFAEALHDRAAMDVPVARGHIGAAGCDRTVEAVSTIPVQPTGSDADEPGRRARQA